MPLRIIFSSDDEIRCVFHTLVVKTESLKIKYPGGVRAFVEQYNGRCNKKLAVICGMGEEDLDDAFTDIENSGLIDRLDFAYFDASRDAMEYALFKKLYGKMGRQVDFSIDWIEGYVHNGGTIVRYKDPREDRNASDQQSSDN